jgi:hypothetical protein
MHDAVVADAFQQQLQADSAAETDVRCDRTAPNLRGFNGGGDRPLISPIQ